MKIKKNLSDAEMFQGYKEMRNFETDIYGEEEPNLVFAAKQPAKKSNELLMPVEAQEKLNQYLLEMAMEWFKNGNGEADWKVIKEKGQIVIKPVVSKKKVAK
ncbi:MAG: hypothetical protein RSE47_03450 [Acidaminococcaceae bacterium]